MSIAESLHRAETELARQRELLAMTVARISGLEAEIAALRAGTTPTPVGEPASLTDAIVSVVRDADTAQRPVDVLATLEATGTTSDIKTVSSTMHYLAGRGRLIKAGRGRYLAP